jgi:CheY-like chemotaxis protein
MIVEDETNGRTPAPSETPTSAEVRASARPVILVVDDDPDVLFALAETLSEEGYDVRCAGDGIEALESIEERRPDLIITDLLMPTMTGFELLGALHDDPNLASIPTLIVTGARLPEAQRAPGSVFAKPLDLDRLLRAITAYTADEPVGVAGVARRRARGPREFS